jgi:hypothetical protein
MKQKLIDDLEKCISAMIAGVPIEKSLQGFPDHATELNKLLKTAELVNSFREENIPLDAKVKNQNELLEQVERFRVGNKQGNNSLSIEWLTFSIRNVFQSLSNVHPLAGRVILALILAGLFLVFSGGLLVTSAKSLPGDSLYPVKRVVEDIKVYLATSLEVRHEFEHVYSEKRVDEVVKLMGLAREQQISFEGIVSSMDGSNWKVSDIRVIINPETTIFIGNDGGNGIVPGMLVEVEGDTSSQGWVYAKEIHLREYRLNGILEEFNTKNLKISGIPIAILPITQIDPDIQVGDEVTVLIRSEDDGLVALAILRELHPESTKEMNFSTEITPTPELYPTNNGGEERFFIGTLEIVSTNYWVVSGQDFYIISGTEISEDINMGDVISVKYSIELNGSFTAYEIDSKNDADISGELDEQESTEHMEEQDEHRTSETTSSDDDETEESEHHSEPEGTPKPTEVEH